MKVSIQGISGAFHEEAARNYFGKEITIAEHMSFDTLVTEVKDGDSDFGVMAVENTISGTIHSNLTLIRQSGLQIIGEVYLRIQQNLVGLPGTKLHELNQVASHYMAINQCREFFQEHPNIQLIDMEDTALSIRQVAEEQNKSKAGIGSRIAAEIYGLEILAEGIESNKNNYTRFLIVSKTGTSTTSNLEVNKASLHVMIANKPGSLAQLLNLINYVGLDLTKIESMPVIGEPWHYQFYLDILFETEQHFLELIPLIKPITDELTILGKYKNQQVQS